MRRSGIAAARAVPSDRWMATSFGTSSPKRTCAEREDGERRHVDGDVHGSRGRGCHSRARPRAVENGGHGRLADPAEAEARERDAELGDRQVPVEPTDDRLGDDRLSVPLSGA